MARIEDMKARRNALRLVQRGQAEIHRRGCLIVAHQQGRTASRTEQAMPGFARCKATDMIRAGGDDEIVRRYRSECHRRATRIELAGPAMAPAGVGRRRYEAVANRP